jgi:hypothetical protein
VGKKKGTNQSIVKQRPLSLKPCKLVGMRKREGVSLNVGKKSGFGGGKPTTY